ncbi:MAG: cyclase family protein, partial [Acetobacteraceae bacterium]
MGASVLADLAEALESGGVEVIDLAQPLEPGTPIISLPPEFGQSAPFRIERISSYDARGPAWTWSNLSFGEHTGTHFDAPVHWITGKDLPDNTLDTIPPRRFVAPANVID